MTKALYKVKEQEEDFSWLIASRGWTKDFALGFLNNLFKLHSLGMGGFLAFIAANKDLNLSSTLSKILLIATFIFLIIGLGTVLWSGRLAYTGQDEFSLDGLSKVGAQYHKWAKIWSFVSMVFYVLAAISFGSFLVICIFR